LKVHFISVFHSVGQGLFYTSDIYAGRSDFKIVYDCGAERGREHYIEAAINRHKRYSRNKKKIDLLILSHLHYDHISGLQNLMDNFEVKDVFLPYLSPTERLILALEYINLSSEFEWYYSFLSDPVVFLIENGVERVILMGGEEGDEGPDIPEPENLPENPNDNLLKLDIEKFPQDNKIPVEKNWQEYKGYKLFMLNHIGYAVIRDIRRLPLWIFRFFNYKIPQPNLKKFDECLKHHKLPVIDIKSLISSQSEIKKIKECYHTITKKTLKDLNNTSLMLYHGPLGRYNLEFAITPFFKYDYYNNNRKYSFNRFAKIGQFLTGDINLNHNYYQIIEHFSKVKSNILITMVPHHGSNKSWKDKILTDLTYSNFWIISAGIKNKFHHPSIDTVMDIVYNGKYLLWANERNSVIIKGEIEWI